MFNVTAVYGRDSLLKHKFSHHKPTLRDPFNWTSSLKQVQVCGSQKNVRKINHTLKLQGNRNTTVAYRYEAWSRAASFVLKGYQREESEIIHLSHEHEDHATGSFVCMTSAR
jgi:hypothetical protein